MNVLIGLFRRYGLAANIAKSCTMTCHPGALQVGMSEEAMVLKCTGGGRLIPSETPKADTMPGVWSWSHCRAHDGTPPPHAWNWYRNRLELADGHTYSEPTPGRRCEIPAEDKSMTCPFPGCLGSSHTWNSLIYHLKINHWEDRTRILEEHPNPLPRCEQCRSHNRHYALEKCKQGEERCLRSNTLQQCIKASRVSFNINVDTLTLSEAFPYLGQKTTCNKSDWAAV